ncbi:hypothetical protein V499_00562, partial [Pseudogymnoascus sp. VKM F-103]
MHSEGPLKKKYDRKCVPVRRVSSWEREQIEKRQKHLKNFKGVKWQKLHREDELRKAKAKADGIRYRREPPPPTPITIQNLRIFTMEEAKKRKEEQGGFEKRIFDTIFKIIEDDPASKFLRMQVRCIEQLREKSPPRQTDPTLLRAEKQLFQLIKDHGYISDVKLQARTVKRLQSAAARARDDASELSKPVQPEQRREVAGPSPAPDPADKDAPEGSEPGDREHVRARETAGPAAALAAPVPADEDVRERSRPIKAEHGDRQESRRAKTPPAASALHKHFLKLEASESSLADLHDLPSPPRPVRHLVLAPTPDYILREEKKNEEPLDTNTSQRKFPRSTGSASSVGGPLDPPSPPRHAREPALAPKPDYILRQEDKRNEESLDSNTNQRKFPRSTGSASSVGGPLDPQSPRNTTRPVPGPKAAPIQRRENKRHGEPLDPDTSRKLPPKPQTSAFSVGDPLDPPPSVHHARQTPPAPTPSQVYQQGDTQTGVPLHTNTLYKPPPKSIASASSIGDRFDLTSPSHRAKQSTIAPQPPQGQRQKSKQPVVPIDAGTRHKSPPKLVDPAPSIGDPQDAPPPSQRAKTPIPALKPSRLPREETARPSTAPEASARPSKRPDSRASSTSIGSRFDLPTQPPRGPQGPAPNPPQRGRQPIAALKPSPLHREETARPSTAPEASAPANKRPQSSASNSSIGSRFAPSPPPRARQPAPLPRPSPLHRQETARPSTAPESGAATNKRPRSSVSVSSHASTFAPPRSPSRGRQRERSITPPPPKRRRHRRGGDDAAALQSPNRHYPPSDS